MNNFHRNVATMMYNTQCLPENFEQCSLEKTPWSHACIWGYGVHAMFLGSEISLESHIFGFKICKHELPILRREEFSATTIFSTFNYVTPQK